MRLINSPFWTNHLYNSDHVRYLDCFIYAPTNGPVKAPSSDAVDIDKCHDILISGCYMNVNDDAVVLKGGKGTWADTMSVNGPVERVLVENCHYGTVHGMLTLGSESLHDRNIIIRNCVADNVNRVIWLKMRPDTPQHYEYITVDGIKGRTQSFLVVRPWSQFFNPQKRDNMPMSECNNITIRNVDMECSNFFDVGSSDKYKLRDFTFENIKVTDDKGPFDATIIPGTKLKNVDVRRRVLPRSTAEAKAGVRWWWFGSAVDELDLKWNLDEYGCSVRASTTCFSTARPTAQGRLLECQPCIVQLCRFGNDGYSALPLWNELGNQNGCARQKNLHAAL